MELTILGLILAVIALFFVHPKEAKRSLQAWFSPLSKVFQRRKSVTTISANDFFDRLGIDDIKIENLFISNPLPISRLKSVYIDKWLEYPDKFNNSFKHIIEDKKRIASIEGRTFDNNGSYSLHRIDVSRPESEKGRRENIYTLVCYPTDYEHFVFPNLVLDEQIYYEFSQEKDTVRNITGLSRDVLSIANIDKLEPFHFKIGTGSILLTNDGYVVASIRSRKQFVAGDIGNNIIQMHLSTAEGMFRSITNPTSSDLFEGQPNPFATSVRSFADELNLHSQHGITPENIRCLGYFMDRKRAQPFFLFILKSKTLSLSDVFSQLGDTPDDIHENDWIVGLKWSPTNILKLFKGNTFSSFEYEVPSRDKEEFERSISGNRVRLASNHAKAGFAVAALSEFGGNSCFYALKEIGL